MTKKFMMTMAMAVLAVCLISGGCSRIDDSKVESWKDMFKIPVIGDNSKSSDQPAMIPDLISPAVEQMVVNLYFVDSQTKQLVLEQRSIEKVEGIARQTMHELLKGPTRQGLQAVVPAGTQLLDINIKSDGLCIVDLSREANQVNSPQQGELMVQAIADTLGQFSSVREVSFLVDGEKVRVLGTVDISQPVLAPYHHK